MVTPAGYSCLRKDRTNKRGDGAVLLCRCDLKIEEMPMEGNQYECLWAKVATPNQDYVASAYHPPSYDYCETHFIGFLVNSCDSVLVSTPNAKLITAGDVNQLNLKCLMQQSDLSQLVKSPTRKEKILDVILTNTPNLFGKVCCKKSLVQTDH